MGVKTERIDGHVLDLLQRQRGLYAELRGRADEQRSLIDRNDADGLLKLLSERQKLVDHLASLNNSLEPLRDRWDRVLASMSPDGRQRAKALVIEVNQLLTSILQDDAKDSDALSHRREAVGCELAQATAGRQVTAAYATDGSHQPQFFDQTDA